MDKYSGGGSNERLLCVYGGLGAAHQKNGAASYESGNSFRIANRSAFSERDAQGNLSQFNSLDFLLPWFGTRRPVVKIHSPRLFSFFPWAWRLSSVPSGTAQMFSVEQCGDWFKHGSFLRQRLGRRPLKRGLTHKSKTPILRPSSSIIRHGHPRGLTWRTRRRRCVALELKLVGACPAAFPVGPRQLDLHQEKISFVISCQLVARRMSLRGTRVE